ncbi:transcriptional repressor [Candidatus Sumerlaeota bacterium]|nr:transcriptional repressor [Candidatus Sumerlaeota bacterium]
MATGADSIQRRLDAFTEACHERGLKVTHQRVEIYRELVSSEDHPDAESIHRGVRRRIPTISLDTVYRNLKFMAEQGLLSTVGLSHERLRFDANMVSHHHFVCEECGSIRDFTCTDFDGMRLPRGASKLGRPHSAQVHVKGICNVCLGGRRK